MSERIQVRRPDAMRIVRPTRAPVTTYTPPPQNTDGQQLAASLSELVPSLRRLSGVLGEQKAEKDKADGAARARELAAQGRTTAEMIRNKEIAPHESAWFRVGAYETMGRASGMTYVGDFLAALGKSGIPESAHDLKVYDDFERQFREQWVETNLSGDPEPFLINAFGATVDGQMAGFRNEFARQAGQRLAERNVESFRSEVFEMAQMFAGTDYSPSERVAVIRLAQDRQYATGAMTYDQINRLTVSAIASAAVRLRDPELLDMLDEMPTSKTSRGYLGGTTYGTEAREKAQDAINRLVDGDIRREEAIARRTKDAAIRTISSGMVQTLQQDPGADITKFTEEMRLADPTYIPTLIQMRDAIAGGVYRDDPKLVETLLTGIYTLAPGSSGYTTRRDLDRAFGAQRLTMSTYLRFSGEIDKRDEAGGSGRFLRNPILTDIANETRRIFASEYREDVPGVRANAQNAADEAVNMMLQWLIANPDAGPADINAAKSTIRQDIVDRRIGVQTEATKGGKDIAPAAIPRARFYMADPQLSAQMERELEERFANIRNSFSFPVLSTLRTNGIDPTKLGRVRDFVNEQTAWQNSPVFKP